MGTSNAVAFFLLGSLMGFLPAFVPAYFSSPAINPSELWLEFMGILQGSLGMFHLLRNEVVPVVLNLSAWRLSKTPLAERPQPAVILRPSAAEYLNGQGSREHTLAA